MGKLLSDAGAKMKREKVRKIAVEFAITFRVWIFELFLESHVMEFRFGGSYEAMR